MKQLSVDLTFDAPNCPGSESLASREGDGEVPSSLAPFILAGADDTLRTSTGSGTTWFADGAFDLLNKEPILCDEALMG